MKIICLYAVLFVMMCSRSLMADASSSSFSSSSSSSDDVSIRPFRISIPQSILDEIQTKLSYSNFPEPYESFPEGENEWTRGTSIRYLKELREFWYNGASGGNSDSVVKSTYDWRVTEAALNEEMPQFITKIDDFDVHFIHVRSPHPHAIPLLFTHGWPGSFLECRKILPLLTRPTNTSDQAFHVICPSIPGYGFSSKPKKAGFGAKQAAELFQKLMAKLNYDQYVAQGGDWGSAINSYLAIIDQEHCLGLHINMFVAAPPVYLFEKRNFFYAAWRSLNTIIDMVMPSLRFDPIEAAMVTAPLEWGWEMTGYFHEQSTKPDTLGIALEDSPLSLASWLVEKYRLWSDCDGDVETRFDKIALLDHITLYYVTRTITSSMRFYYETSHDKTMGLLHTLMNWDVKVPTAFAALIKEPSRAPEKWVKEYYNLKQYSHFPRGGHFAALEEPQLLVEDIRKFVRHHVSYKPNHTDMPAKQNDRKEDL